MNVITTLHIAGVWTLEEKGVTPNFATTFDKAEFSVGHLALVALEEAGML